jgi:hypothetical protein
MPLKEAVPEAGTWTIDTVHSFVSFTVEHMGLALAGGIASGLKRDEFCAGDFEHVPLPLGGIMVPHTVAVALDIEATRNEPEA